MATPEAAPAAPRNLHVDAIQTVTPARAVEPGRVRQIAVSEPLRAEELRSHARVVLYYRRGREGETAWAVAAWMKETLNAELPAEPLLAGRLRREREVEGCWEVKYNDSGVRMVQASAEMSMAEFLAAKDRDSREAMLAYWVDIDRENPQFSALFYVQVTEFQGDGYSIGISCSLLLADPLFLIRFVKSWAATHSRMLAQGKLSSTPIFHLGYFTRPGQPTHLSSTPLESNSTSSTSSNTATILFKVPQADGRRTADLAALASRCLEEASTRLESKPISRFTLIVNDHSGDLKVESCVREGMTQSDRGFGGALDVAWWDELGAEEIAFGEGNKPIHVSYRIVSCADQGLAVVTLPCNEDVVALMISATVPTKI